MSWFSMFGTTLFQTLMFGTSWFQTFLGSHSPALAYLQSCESPKKFGTGSFQTLETHSKGYSGGNRNFSLASNVGNDLVPNIFWALATSNVCPIRAVGVQKYLEHGRSKFGLLQAFLGSRSLERPTVCLSQGRSKG